MKHNLCKQYGRDVMQHGHIKSNTGIKRQVCVAVVGILLPPIIFWNDEERIGKDISPIRRYTCTAHC